MPIDKKVFPTVGAIIDAVTSRKEEAGTLLDNIYEKLLPDPSTAGSAGAPRSNSWVTNDVLESILDTAKFLGGLHTFKSTLNRVSIQGPGLPSLEKYIPSYVQAQKCATIYSNHILASDMGHIRSIPNTRIACHRMREGDTKHYSAFTNPIRGHAEPDSWVGTTENVAVFGKPVQCKEPRTSVPKFITEILPPAPLLPPSNLSSNEEMAKKIQEWTFINKLGIKQEKLTTVLNNCGINFSRTLMTPMAFVDLGNEGWTQYYDAAHLATQKVKAIEIQKLRNDFTLVDITLAQYLENPQKYYVVLDIPKIVTFITKGYIGDVGKAIQPSGMGIQVLTLLPTLIIHPAMLTTGSETVAENLYLLLENLNKANLNNLIHRENYLEALETLKDTTNHWDGVLQVLAGADPAAIRTALDELGPSLPSTAKDFLPGNASINRVYCSPDFRKWTQAKIDAEKHAGSVSLITNSLAGVQKNHRSTTLQLGTLKAQVVEAEKTIASLDSQGTTLHANLQTAKNSTAEAEKLARETYERVGQLAESPDLDRFSKEVYISSIGIAESRGMQHEIHLAPRASFNNVQCTTENKPTQPRNHCAGRDVGDLIQLLQITPAGTPAYTQALIKLLALPSIKLTYVNLFTTQPMKMYVDLAAKAREKCDVVVGGPYNITVSDGTKMAGKLYLASPDGVFGIKAVGHDVADLKQHPHSKEMKVNRKDPKSFVQFIKTATTMCFGEAEVTLKKAFTEKNLEEIRNVIYQWIISVWSMDQWGANWSWFPTPDRVSIEGKFNTTKEG